MASRGASAVVLQCERLKNASFVSDKRDIIEDLKGATTTHRQELVTHGLPVFIPYLKGKGGDVQVVQGVLEILIDLLSSATGGVGAAPAAVAAALLSDSSCVSAVLEQLHQGTVLHRTLVIQFLSALARTSWAGCVGAIVACGGAGMNRLVDLLDAKQPEVRNEALLLLTLLVHPDEASVASGVDAGLELRNFLAFQEGFDRVAAILSSALPLPPGAQPGQPPVAAEGGAAAASSGDPFPSIEDCAVAADAVSVVAGVVRANALTQRLLLQSPVLKQLLRVLDLPPRLPTGAPAAMVDAVERGVGLAVQVLHSLVSEGESEKGAGMGATAAAAAAAGGAGAPTAAAAAVGTSHQLQAPSPLEAALADWYAAHDDSGAAVPALTAAQNALAAAPALLDALCAIAFSTYGSQHRNGGVAYMWLAAPATASAGGSPSAAAAAAAAVTVVPAPLRLLALRTLCAATAGNSKVAAKLQTILIHNPLQWSTASTSAEAPADFELALTSCVRALVAASSLPRGAPAPAHAAAAALRHHAARLLHLALLGHDAERTSFIGYAVAPPPVALPRYLLSTDFGSVRYAHALLKGGTDPSLDMLTPTPPGKTLLAAVYDAATKPGAASGSASGGAGGGRGGASSSSSSTSSSSSFSALALLQLASALATALQSTTSEGTEPDVTAQEMLLCLTVDRLELPGGGSGTVFGALLRQWTAAASTAAATSTNSSSTTRVSSATVLVMTLLPALLAAVRGCANAVTAVLREPSFATLLHNLSAAPLPVTTSSTSMVHAAVAAVAASCLQLAPSDAGAGVAVSRPQLAALLAPAAPLGAALQRFAFSSRTAQAVLHGKAPAFTVDGEATQLPLVLVDAPLLDAMRSIAATALPAAAAMQLTGTGAGAATTAAPAEPPSAVNTAETDRLHAQVEQLQAALAAEQASHAADADRLSREAQDIIQAYAQLEAAYHDTSEQLSQAQAAAAQGAGGEAGFLLSQKESQIASLQQSVQQLQQQVQEAQAAAAAATTTSQDTAGAAEYIGQLQGHISQLEAALAAARYEAESAQVHRHPPKQQGQEEAGGAEAAQDLQLLVAQKDAVIEALQQQLAHAAATAESAGNGFDAAEAAAVIADWQGAVAERDGAIAALRQALEEAQAQASQQQPQPPQDGGATAEEVAALRHHVAMLESQLSAQRMHAEEQAAAAAIDAAATQEYQQASDAQLQQLVAQKDAQVESLQHHIEALRQELMAAQQALQEAASHSHSHSGGHSDHHHHHAATAEVEQAQAQARIRELEAQITSLRDNMVASVQHTVTEALREATAREAGATAALRQELERVRAELLLTQQRALFAQQSHHHAQDSQQQQEQHDGSSRASSELIGLKSRLREATMQVEVLSAQVTALNRAAAAQEAVCKTADMQVQSLLRQVRDARSEVAESVSRYAVLHEEHEDLLILLALREEEGAQLAEALRNIAGAAGETAVARVRQFSIAALEDLANGGTGNSGAGGGSSGRLQAAVQQRYTQQEQQHSDTTAAASMITPPSVLASGNAHAFFATSSPVAHAVEAAHTAGASAAQHEPASASASAAATLFAVHPPAQDSHGAATATAADAGRHMGAVEVTGDHPPHFEPSHYATQAHAPAPAHVTALTSATTGSSGSEDATGFFGQPTQQHQQQQEEQQYAHVPASDMAADGWGAGLGEVDLGLGPTEQQQYEQQQQQQYEQQQYVQQQYEQQQQQQEYEAALEAQRQEMAQEYYGSAGAGTGTGTDAGGAGGEAAVDEYTYSLMQQQQAWHEQQQQQQLQQQEYGTDSGDSVSSGGGGDAAAFFGAPAAPAAAAAVAAEAASRLAASASRLFQAASPLKGVFGLAASSVREVAAAAVETLAAPTNDQEAAAAAAAASEAHHAAPSAAEGWGVSDADLDLGWTDSAAAEQQVQQQQQRQQEEEAEESAGQPQWSGSSYTSHTAHSAPVTATPAPTLAAAASHATSSSTPRFVDVELTPVAPSRGSSGREGSGGGGSSDGSSHAVEHFAMAAHGSYGEQQEEQPQQSGRGRGWAAPLPLFQFVADVATNALAHATTAATKHAEAEGWPDVLEHDQVVESEESAAAAEAAAAPAPALATGSLAPTGASGFFSSLASTFLGSNTADAGPTGAATGSSDSSSSSSTSHSGGSGGSGSVTGWGVPSIEGLEELSPQTQQQQQHAAFGVFGQPAAFGTFPPAPAPAPASATAPAPAPAPAPPAFSTVSRPPPHAAPGPQSQTQTPASLSQAAFFNPSTSLNPAAMLPVAAAAHPPTGYGASGGVTYSAGGGEMAHGGVLARKKRGAGGGGGGTVTAPAPPGAGFVAPGMPAASAMPAPSAASVFGGASAGGSGSSVSAAFDGSAGSYFAAAPPPQPLHPGSGASSRRNSGSAGVQFASPNTAKGWFR